MVSQVQKLFILYLNLVYDYDNLWSDSDWFIDLWSVFHIIGILWSMLYAAYAVYARVLSQGWIDSTLFGLCVIWTKP